MNANVILFGLTLLAASARTPAKAADPDAVFAHADRGMHEILVKHAAALAKSGAPADPTLSDESSIELLGLSHVGGAPAYKLKVHHEDTVEYRWIDIKTFLETKRSVATQEPDRVRGSQG